MTAHGDLFTQAMGMQPRKKLGGIIKKIPPRTTHEKISRDVELFMARGGEIRVVGEGDSGIPRTDLNLSQAARKAAKLKIHNQVVTPPHRSHDR